MPESVLTQEDINSIAKALADDLVQKRRLQWVDPETHYQHHQWVLARMEREKERRELANKIIQSACIWAIPLILVWAASSFWDSILQAVRAGLQ